MSVTKTLKKSLHVRLRVEEKQVLKEIAEKFGISESDVVRLALKKYFEELGMNT